MYQATPTIGHVSRLTAANDVAIEAHDGADSVAALNTPICPAFAGIFAFRTDAHMRQVFCIEDLKAGAKRRLPRMVFDYLEGGAEDERSIRENVEAFSRIRFAPKRLVDVSRRSIARSILGRAAKAPFVVGPTGLNGIFWPDGDLELARAARAAGVPFALSTAANASIEQVAKIGGDLWFQLYVVHRGLADRLVERAERADFSTLILTVDVAVNGKRERDLRNGFAFPFRYSPRTVWDGVTHPAWSFNLLRHGMPKMANLAADGATSLEAQAALLKREMDASFDWDALARLRDKWPRRLLVKGILDPGDVARCFSIGVDGVVISNHGGRQVDSLRAPIEVLPELRGLGPMFMDGGVRRGADIVKAVAARAQAALLGRSVLYGLAANGQAGAALAIQILIDEIDRTLALIGCPSINDLTSEHISV